MPVAHVSRTSRPRERRVEKKKVLHRDLFAHSSRQGIRHGNARDCEHSFTHLYIHHRRESQAEGAVAHTQTASVFYVTRHLTLFDVCLSERVALVFIYYIKMLPLSPH